jgi:putative PIN family toxin of toxin-antitoxin system
VKVVFDTNVFVSALTFRGGRGEQALGRIIEGRDSLVLSKPILDELLRILATEFSREREELARVAVYLAELSQIVEPSERLDILSDEPDNRILECAVAGGVDVIVTGDRSVLKLGDFRGVKIVSLREYLESG